MHRPTIVKKSNMQKQSLLKHTIQHQKSHNQLDGSVPLTVEPEGVVGAMGTERVKGTGNVEAS